MHKSFCLSVLRLLSVEACPLRHVMLIGLYTLAGNWYLRPAVMVSTGLGSLYLCCACLPAYPVALMHKHAVFRASTE